MFGTWVEIGRGTDLFEGSVVGLYYPPQQRCGVLFLHPQTGHNVELVLSVADYEVLSYMAISKALAKLGLNQTTQNNKSHTVRDRDNHPATLQCPSHGLCQHNTLP